MTKYFLEIKNRILLIVLTGSSILLTSYLYKETLLFLLAQPERFSNKNGLYSTFYFIFTNVTEIFSVYISLITFLSFQFIFLFLLYHCFIFFSSAMYKSEYYFFLSILKMICGVWFSSILISHFLIIPLTWDFFYSFQELFSKKLVNVHFEAKLTEYFDFYVLIYYLCVVYFQVFTVLLFFLKYINSEIIIIKKFRKVYYYFFVIFSTLVSPPDIIVQLCISLFLIVIYEVSVFIATVRVILIRQPIKAG